ncbi:MAG: thermonuclease family protein [Anaerolineae bacterium]|nr:thermonuclease family protein [Anaerolineae bacterium]
MRTRYRLRSSGCGRRLAAWLRRWLEPFWAEKALVAYVLDGDSIRLADGREVRYLGLDAPERYGPDGRPMPWAEAARAANARLVEGQYVRLVRGEGEPDRDVYGRLLRHVYRGRLWVNGRLVAMGLARVRQGEGADPRLAHLQRLEAEARRRMGGLGGG